MLIGCLGDYITILDFINYIAFGLFSLLITIYLCNKIVFKYNNKFDVYSCEENDDYEAVFNSKTGYNCKFKEKNMQNEYSVALYDKNLTVTDTYVKE